MTALLLEVRPDKSAKLVLPKNAFPAVSKHAQRKPSSRRRRILGHALALRCPTSRTASQWCFSETVNAAERQPIPTFGSPARLGADGEISQRIPRRRGLETPRRISILRSGCHGAPGADRTGVRIIRSNSENATSAAASTVVSPVLSYAGATSTTSPPTIGRPARPSSTLRSSRLDHPPGSAVPVAGLC